MIKTRTRETHWHLYNQRHVRKIRRRLLKTTVSGKRNQVEKPLLLSQFKKQIRRQKQFKAQRMHQLQPAFLLLAWLKNHPLLRCRRDTGISIKNAIAIQSILQTPLSVVISRIRDNAIKKLKAGHQVDHEAENIQQL